jgi:hypothetical protein
MSLLRQLGSEIYSMFAGDAVMSVSTVAIVVVAAALRFLTPIPSSLVGVCLLAGCLALLIIRVLAYPRNARR